MRSLFTIHIVFIFWYAVILACHCTPTLYFYAVFLFVIIRYGFMSVCVYVFMLSSTTNCERLCSNILAARGTAEYKQCSWQINILAARCTAECKQCSWQINILAAKGTAECKQCSWQINILAARGSARPWQINILAARGTAEYNSTYGR